MANGAVEQVELTGPLRARAEHWATPMLIAVTKDEVQAFNDLDRGDTFDPDFTVDQARVGGFAALVLPGEWQTPTPCARSRQRSQSSATSSPRASQWRAPGTR